MQVRKRDENREEFIREKIVVAIVKSGGALAIARRVAQDVETVLSMNPAMTTEQIRTEVVKRLKEIDIKAYDSWMAYDRREKDLFEPD
jgi:transcriptional regulator NrdR family protein